MTTAWIGGRASKATPGGVTRRGPVKPTGLARSDHWGSVRTLTPSSWTRSVAWPTHVTTGLPGFARRRSRSGSASGKLARLGVKVVDQMRPVKKDHRVQKPGRAQSGLRLAKPRSRWWAGSPGTGPPTPRQPPTATASTRARTTTCSARLFRWRGALGLGPSRGAAHDLVHETQGLVELRGVLASSLGEIRAPA